MRQSSRQQASVWDIRVYKIYAIRCMIYEEQAMATAWR